MSWLPTAGHQVDDVATATSGQLEVAGVSKRFPKMEHAALHDVDFRLGSGRFQSIIGPSGCGKTTLLRIIGGLTAPSTGTVRIDGHPSMGPGKEKSLVFQHFNLFPWRTALGNAAYGLEMQRVGKRERNATAKKFLKLVGLSGFEDAYPHQLSGGMRQRVGLARALAVQPKVLLMDEPFGALDALTREGLQVELEKICELTGLTVVFVTHSIDEAIYLSDEVLVMGSAPGRIIDYVTIDLPRPRWRYDVRSHESFGPLRSGLWETLHREMAEHSGNTRRPSYE